MQANVMFLRTFSVGLLSYHNFQALTLSDFFATLILGYYLDIIWRTYMVELAKKGVEPSVGWEKG